MATARPALRGDLLRSRGGRRGYERGLETRSWQGCSANRRFGLGQRHGIGGSRYEAQLSWRDGVLRGAGDCPVGIGGGWRKHQLAAALLWANSVGNSAEVQTGTSAVG